MTHTFETPMPTPDLPAVKQRQQQAWASGDYHAVAARIMVVAERLVDTADLHAGWRVLDVATGSGNAAIAAARLGVASVGVDYVPSLLERARVRAAAEGLTVDLVEGDAEALPFEDASFDAVTSVFGSMFAPDHERVAAELLRVTRPGGTIALASWTPDGFLGDFFRTMAAHVPPPAGVRSPMLWGTESHLRDLFGDGIASLDAVERTFTFRFRSAMEFVSFFRDVVRPDPQGVRVARRRGPRGARARPRGAGGPARPARHRRDRDPGDVPGGRRDPALTLETWPGRREDSRRPAFRRRREESSRGRSRTSRRPPHARCVPPVGPEEVAAIAAVRSAVALTTSTSWTRSPSDRGRPEPAVVVLARSSASRSRGSAPAEPLEDDPEPAKQRATSVRNGRATAARVCPQCSSFHAHDFSHAKPHVRGVGFPAAFLFATTALRAADEASSARRARSGRRAAAGTAAGARCRVRTLSSLQSRRSIEVSASRRVPG